MALKNWKALSVAAAMLASTVQANAATTWEHYLYTGVTHPVTVLLKEFAEEVKKRTNGELIINVRASGELPFKATEVVKIVGDGLVQIGSGSPGFIGGSTPIATVGNHVGLIRTYADMEKAWPIIQKYADKKFATVGAKTLFHWNWPTQQVFGTAKIKPPSSLKDFAGLKIRTVAPQEAEMLRRLSAASVALTLPEVPVALERGVMDGLVSAAFNVVSTKWYEFLKWVYVSDLHIGGPNYELVNIAAYNALPANVRQVLDKTAAEWSAKMNATISARDAADLQSLKDKHGLELVQAKPEDLKQLNNIMQSYWDEWAAQQGPDGVAMMKEIRQVLGR